MQKTSVDAIQSLAVVDNLEHKNSIARVLQVQFRPAMRNFVVMLLLLCIATVFYPALFHWNRLSKSD